MLALIERLAQGGISPFNKAAYVDNVYRTV